jgi:hypothetical protein
MQKIDKWKLHELTRKYQKTDPLKVALMNWMCSGEAEFNYFVTLTYKDDIKCRSEVEKHCKNFTNRYNVALGYKKHNTLGKYDKTAKAPMICIVEGDGVYKRFHVHLFLFDNNKQITEFKRAVKDSWFEATDKKGSRLISDFKPITDYVGLTNYLTKEVSTADIDAVVLDATNKY